MAKWGGAYPHTLHTVRLFMCILHVNGGMKGQKLRHTYSHHLTGCFGYAYRSFLKISKKVKRHNKNGYSAGPGPSPLFFEEPLEEHPSTKVLKDYEVDG